MNFLINDQRSKGLEHKDDNTNNSPEMNNIIRFILNFSNCMLDNFVTLGLKQNGCLNSTIFLQDSEPPHIVSLLKQNLRHCLSFGRKNSRVFLTAWHLK